MSEKKDYPCTTEAKIIAAIEATMLLCREEIQLGPGATAAVGVAVVERALQALNKHVNAKEMLDIQLQIIGRILGATGAEVQVVHETIGRPVGKAPLVH